jgi:hypothetical protein
MNLVTKVSLSVLLLAASSGAQALSTGRGPVATSLSAFELSGAGPFGL